MPQPAFLKVVCVFAVPFLELIDGGTQYNAMLNSVNSIIDWNDNLDAIFKVKLTFKYPFLFAINVPRFNVFTSI